MRKAILLLVSLALYVSIGAQTASSIDANVYATFNAAFDENLPDSLQALQPWGSDLGIRRVIVADPDNDGQQEVLATDYSNGGRVHVLEMANDSTLEVVWSSPVYDSESGSTPRFPRVGDMDGDGNMEIIFEQRGEARIAIFEYINETELWGTEAAFEITNDNFRAAGALEDLRFHREVLMVDDLDGDGRSEIIPYGDSPRLDVYIVGVEGSFPGFASIVIEGGHPDETQNGRNWATGSHWNSAPADIDGDGQTEIVNHHWDRAGFWSIDVEGPDSYIYPDTTNPDKDKIYHRYGPDGTDPVSYFGFQPVDVNGDGKDELVGTLFGLSHNMALLSFDENDDDVYIWGGTEEEINSQWGIIKESSEIAALAGNTAAELWPVVGGDLNQDGVDEIYTGGGNGLNLVAVQYNEGSLVDPASYSANLVYDGTGGDTYATYKIYNGKTTITGIDTIVVNPDSTVYDTTWAFDASQVDTVKEEVPFTSYIYARDVDLDNDGNYEAILSNQSVYDSIDVRFYNWIDSTSQWDYDKEVSYKQFNPNRISIIALEYTGETGIKDNKFAIVSPNDYQLHQNYPNPFNPVTNLKFTLPVDKKISLKIFDMLGREVKTLVSGKDFKKGSYELQWNGTNNYGVKVASGHYVARLEYGAFAKSIKMTLLK